MKRIAILLLILSMLLMLAGCSWFDRETEILAYLDEELTDAEGRAVATQIGILQGAIRVEYVTAEQVFADFVGKLEDPSIVEGFDSDVLRSHCVVTVMESDSEQLAREIKKLEGVDDVSVMKSSHVKEAIMDAID